MPTADRKGLGEVSIADWKSLGSPGTPKDRGSLQDRVTSRYGRRRTHGRGADADHEYAFGVLGPLRVTRAGIPLSLGGRQQRAVLARLLLADDAGLTVDQLADALWAAAVPAGAAGTIQTYVFHLRRTLEPNRDRGRPGQVVITDQGRYRLAIRSDALDSAAFERRVDSGERLLPTAHWLRP